MIQFHSRQIKTYKSCIFCLLVKLLIVSIILRHKKEVIMSAHKVVFETGNYEGHPINRENFLIMQEFVPLEHGKCNN